MSHYNDNLDPEDQVDAEENLASIIFDNDDVYISEEAAGRLGRKCLLWVLERFRPDLCEPPRPRQYAPMNQET